jgi:tetratricopeptide (TPR) repeat protein
MRTLATGGRKDEAWKAYERGRDLYFAQVHGSSAPVLPFVHQEDIADRLLAEPLSLLLLAELWYTYLLQERKDDEFHRLDQRLREVCSMTKLEANDLLSSRAGAEFDSGRNDEAVKSLESFLKIKLRNQVKNDAMIAKYVAESERALGEPQEAIKWYRRAVKISRADPSLLSEFLCLVVQEQGENGLRRELPAYYEQARLSPNARLKATVNSFAAWGSLAMENEKSASVYLANAAHYLALASQQRRQPVQSAGGKVVFEKRASLGKDDSTGPSPKDSKLASFRKTYTVRMRTDFVYTIDLISSDKTKTPLDPFLRLESPAAKELAEDDDGAGFPNSRIVHRASEDGDYRIIATSFEPNQTGAFTLKVFEAKNAPVSENVAADDVLVCAVILQIVSERLADSKRLAATAALLRRFPAEQVASVRGVFSLPKRK